MSGARLRGLTWDHRRAVDPLLGALAGCAVSWDRQPLAGFEFEPIERLARRYDLIVFDHPHVGDVVAGGSLLPVDDVLGKDDPFVGPSLASYRMAGHLWGVPIDAACQVAVYRPDLLARLDAAVPQRWDAALALGRAARRRGQWLAMALQGVHGLMTFFTLNANLGRACATDPGAPLVDRATARAALDAMREVASLCPPDALAWNSIAVQDALCARDDLVYCPAVYGFATYAEADRPLRFADLPGPNGPGGSTIGGAGLGISAHTTMPDQALAVARACASAATQRSFAAHHGQPAHRAAWDDAALDARFGGFFRATRASLDGAWIRPRHAGYPVLQKRAGALVEQHLRGALAEADLLDRLDRGHAAGRAA
jgi:multiple sugar transport system substrate-binding protein